MKLYRLWRNAFATYGSLRRDDGTEECVTIELPWVDANHDGISDRNVSCVPAGTYTAERYFSPKHNAVVFRLLNVPGRDYCEIHVANLPVDLLGCIGVGRRFGNVQKASGEKGYGVLESKTAFLAFMANHPEQRFAFTIYDPPAREIAA